MFSSKRMITKYDYDRIQKIMHIVNPSEHYQSIKRLKEKFKRAKLIDSREIKSTIITMNSRFRLKNLGNGYKKEYSLVFPNESDPINNKISVIDSIGTEFLAHEQGEVIHIKEGEDAYYLIEDIIYQPEAAGDYHL